MAKKSSPKKKKGSKRGLPPVKHFVERAVALGAKKGKIVKAASIATAPWVRMKCQFGCGGFGSSLCCPPHTPAPDKMRKVLDAYKRALLLEAVKKGPTGIAAKLEREVFLAGYYKALGLGAGPCYLCEECAFGEGCRNPRQARPCMESCGIDVFKTARDNGFEIDVVRHRGEKGHFFGTVLID
ncbi:MAG: DUF2284 domain-containing protein [Planctomycetota bacterium]|jgi:predicted metal-binding protein